MNDIPQLPLFTIAQDGDLQELPQIVPITSKKIKDLAGQVFGRLTVLGFAGQDRRWQSTWVCRCECGAFCVKGGSNLKHDHTRSCGCLQREVTIKRNYVHGLSHRPEYAIWNDMITRCENPKQIYYGNYGGRGIVICENWRRDFTNFLDDMGQRPTKKHQIDRIDCDGNYSCGHCDQCLDNGWSANCRWATATEQANNRRSSHFLEFQGKRLTIADWARKLNVSHNALDSRIQKGWTVERALTQPFRKSPKRK